MVASSPLTESSLPRPHTDKNGRTFLVRERRIPSNYDLTRAVLIAEGTHNRAFSVRDVGSGKDVVLRVNIDEDFHSLDQQMADEVSHHITMHARGVAPALYDYGYHPQIQHDSTTDYAKLFDSDEPMHSLERGFYWQIMEKFDESLKAFARDDSVEKQQMYRRAVESSLKSCLKKMALAGLFCYDLHPGNVLLQYKTFNKLRLNSIVKLKLMKKGWRFVNSQSKQHRNSSNKNRRVKGVRAAIIDFDSQACILPSRVDAGASRTSMPRSQEPACKLPGALESKNDDMQQVLDYNDAHPTSPIIEAPRASCFKLSTNNMYVALLFTASNNTGRLHKSSGLHLRRHRHYVKEKQHKKTPLFQSLLRRIVKRTTRPKDLLTHGGKVSVSKVLKFISTASIPGSIYSAMDILVWWSGRTDERPQPSAKSLLNALLN
jgi:hypothetical protein